MLRDPPINPVANEFHTRLAKPLPDLGQVVINHVLTQSAGEAFSTLVSSGLDAITSISQHEV